MLKFCTTSNVKISTNFNVKNLHYFFISVGILGKWIEILQKCDKYALKSFLQVNFTDINIYI